MSEISALCKKMRRALRNDTGMKLTPEELRAVLKYVEAATCDI